MDHWETWARSLPGEDTSKAKPMEAQIYLSKPNGKVLTDHKPFTASVQCEINGPMAKDVEIKPYIRPKGTLKVVNSNFGCESQPGFKDKSGNVPKNPARAAGGICFAGAVELHYKPDPESDLGLELIRENAKPDKMYKVQLFPSVGKAQVSGCLFPKDMHDAQWAIQECMKTLTAAGIPPGNDDSAYKITKPLEPVSLKYNMGLVKTHDRVVFDLEGLAKALEDTSVDDLPYPFAEKIMHAVESQELQFKFRITPKTSPLVKVYGKGSINILSCRKPEEADNISAFLEKVVDKHWMEVVGVIPPTDAAIQAYPVKTIINMAAVQRGASIRDVYESY